MGIDLHNITKTFGTFHAVDNVNLHIRTGELVALLGPSGSGKSTLLRIIAGLERPDMGLELSPEVLFDGVPVADTKVRHRGVGFVFQHYSLFRQMTVFENIAFGLRVRPRATRPTSTEIRKQVGRLLDLIQLQSLAQRYPLQLSGGQRQRVALARALAVEPKVLLLDEPFGALDAQVRLDLRRWLRKLHDEIHVTSVFVTHDQEEALEIADRVIVMNEGKIEQDGSPDEVFHTPATPFVMRFIGSANRFRGRIEQSRAVFGELEIESANLEGSGHDSGSEGEIDLYVRPHEIELRRTPNGIPGVEAVIEHIHQAGPVVRIDLRTHAGDALAVDVAHELFDKQFMLCGNTVFAALRRTRVFVG